MVGVAQSVEHWVVASEVAGSIPVTHPIEKQKAFENESFSKAFLIFSGILQICYNQRNRSQVQWFRVPRQSLGTSR